MAKIELNYLSYSLRRTVDLTIIYPTCVCGEIDDFVNKKKTYKNLKGYPVMYLLHGMSGDHSSWINYSSIARYAEENNICVVMISGEDKFYINHASSDLFYDFLNKELPDFITSTFPVSKRKEDTYIAGLSMGGYGALIHGLLNYKKYAAIGAFSAPIYSKRIEKEAGKEVLDIYSIMQKCIKRKINLPPIYLTIGKKDFLFQGNEDLAKLCLENNVNCTYLPIDGFDHEWSFWDRVVYDFISWIPRSDKYKEIKRKV